MPVGPGKYDELCTKARIKARARAVILIVLDGSRGSGFSVQAESVDITADLPALLRSTAAQIEQAYGRG